MNTLNNAASNVAFINHDVVSLENVNKSALVSQMGAELFHNGLNERVAMLTAVAFVGAVDYVEDMEEFMEAFIDGLEITTISIKDHEVEDDIDGEYIIEALIQAGFIDLDLDMSSGNELKLGERLPYLASLRTEAYKPALASDGVERRFGYSKVKHSDLAIEAVHALEDTEYTVDSHMLSLALQVQGILGEDNDDEGYVIKGCHAMDAELAYVSEFKCDTRGRMYQAACHGPNGQASDRSRALMDLYGVPQNYDVEMVKSNIMDELADMCSNIRASAKQLEALGEVAFIKLHITEPDSPVKKPWSFVKGARIMIELKAGNRPYIGMATGLDAKCSGPQLGALMVGDQAIAAACGFTMEELDDAYELCLNNLVAAGFTGFTRNGIKKSYMGIFYGQGYQAFTKLTALFKDEQYEVIEILFGDDEVVSDDVAKKFHKAVTASFGTKMIGVRNLIKGYGKISKGRTKHLMPDGFEVAMNYKVKTNILGEQMEFDTETPDLLLRNNTEFYKFINFAMNTKEVHEGDFARNGFVNMIQATDALLARMIVVNCKRMGAQHIIAVHDCFRVNVTEMHILRAAIKQAYMDLFGSEFNNSTADLPHGTDILALYFQGANKQLVDEADEVMVSQFFSSNKRRMRKINKVPVAQLIENLGKTYYFAK